MQFRLNLENYKITNTRVDMPASRLFLLFSMYQIEWMRRINKHYNKCLFSKDKNENIFLNLKQKAKYFSMHSKFQAF